MKEYTATIPSLAQMSKWNITYPLHYTTELE